MLHWSRGIKGLQRGCSQPRGLKEVAKRSGPVLRGPLQGVSSPELPWASNAGGMEAGKCQRLETGQGLIFIAAAQASLPWCRAPPGPRSPT